MRVLLVEDDAMIGSVVQQGLRDANFAADWVMDGADALDTLRRLQYSLIILDLGLPRTDGMTVLRSLRAAGNNIPILVLTARDTTEDRVLGLDSGADDYLVKPFAMKELLARMRAITRRQDNTATPYLNNGIITLDPVLHEAKVDGAAVRLTGREFSLLQALMQRPGAILSRAELEHRIYGWNEEVESNAVEFLIYSLRKKLGTEAIQNIRGVGWKVSKGP
jgi:two-component system OmpR family response regulator